MSHRDRIAAATSGHSTDEEEDDEDLYEDSFASSDEDSEAGRSEEDGEAGDHHHHHHHHHRRQADDDDDIGPDDLADHGDEEEDELSSSSANLGISGDDYGDESDDHENLAGDSMGEDSGRIDQREVQAALSSAMSDENASPQGTPTLETRDPASQGKAAKPNQQTEAAGKGGKAEDQLRSQLDEFRKQLEESLEQEAAKGGQANSQNDPFGDAFLFDDDASAAAPPQLGKMVNSPSMKALRRQLSVGVESVDPDQIRDMLERRVAIVTRKLLSMRRENESLRNKLGMFTRNSIVSQMENKLRAQAVMIAQLQDQNRSLSNVQRAQAKQLLAEDHLLRSDSYITTLENEITTLKERNKRNQRMITELRKQNGDRNQEINRVRRAYHKSRARVDVLVQTMENTGLNPSLILSQHGLLDSRSQSETTLSVQGSSQGDLHQYAAMLEQQQQHLQRQQQQQQRKKSLQRRRRAALAAARAARGLGDEDGAADPNDDDVGEREAGADDDREGDEDGAGGEDSGQEEAKLVAQLNAAQLGTDLHQPQEPGYHRSRNAANEPGSVPKPIDLVAENNKLHEQVAKYRRIVAAQRGKIQMQRKQHRKQLNKAKEAKDRVERDLVAKEKELQLQVVRLSRLHMACQHLAEGNRRLEAASGVLSTQPRPHDHHHQQLHGPPGSEPPTAPSTAASGMPGGITGSIIVGPDRRKAPLPNVVASPTRPGHSSAASSTGYAPSPMQPPYYGLQPQHPSQPQYASGGTGSGMRPRAPSEDALAAPSPLNTTPLQSNRGRKIRERRRQREAARKAYQERMAKDQSQQPQAQQSLPQQSMEPVPARGSGGSPKNPKEAIRDALADHGALVGGGRLSQSTLSPDRDPGEESFFGGASVDAAASSGRGDSDSDAAASVRERRRHREAIRKIHRERELREKRQPVEPGSGRYISRKAQKEALREALVREGLKPGSPEQPETTGDEAEGNVDASAAEGCNDAEDTSGQEVLRAAEPVS